jgi:hypothetical protein
LTRNPDSPSAIALKQKGAEVVKADLTQPETLIAALDGCWGVFGVTNFYDSVFSVFIYPLIQKIVNDPASEEQQGKNLVLAAKEAGVECFVWSTLPSSLAISNGKYCSQIYENKYKVDGYMAEIGVAGPFLYTGNFFENTVLRGHVTLKENGDLEFRQPVIHADTKCNFPVPHHRYNLDWLWFITRQS